MIQFLFRTLFPEKVYLYLIPPHTFHSRCTHCNVEAVVKIRTAAANLEAIGWQACSPLRHQ